MGEGERGGAHYHDIPFANAGRKWSSMFHANDCAILIFLRRVDVLELVLVMKYAPPLRERTATAKRTENRYSVASRTGVNPCKSSTLDFFFFAFFLFFFFRPSNANHHPFIYPLPPWKNEFFIPSLQYPYNEKFTLRKMVKMVSRRILYSTRVSLHLLI